MLTWRWRRGFREPSVCRSLDPCVQWPPWRAPRRSEAAQKCPARSLSPSLPPTALSPLPARSAHPLSPSAPPRRLPGRRRLRSRPGSGRRACERRAQPTGPESPAAPEQPRPVPGRGAWGGGCASRAHAASFPTWARRPPEPRSSSEARASSGTGRWRHHTEPSLLPGPSPVGLALPHLLQNCRRHQARSAFRRVA